MKITPFRIILAIFFIALFVAIYIFFIQEKPITVVVKAVDKGKVEETVSNTRGGTVKACQRAKLSTSLGGQIAKMNVKEGYRVEKDQILIELWNEDIKAALELALNEAKAAEAMVEEACLKAEMAEREAERRKVLGKKSLVSESELDELVTRASTQKAVCISAKAQAGVARAKVSETRAQLEKTLIKAPFSGVVAEVTGELGEFVTPSPIGIATQPVVDLIDSSCLYVTAPIDEVDAPLVRVGQEARISLDAFSGRTFKGEVKRVAPYVLELEKQARTVEVEVYFTDTEEYKDLLPGYSADVEIILGSTDGVVRAPTEAILEGGMVLVYNSASRVIEDRKVEKGLSNWRYTEIKSGLAPGDLVVISVDREGVRPGVKATAETAR